MSSSSSSLRFSLMVLVLCMKICESGELERMAKTPRIQIQGDVYKIDDIDGVKGYLLQGGGTGVLRCYVMMDAIQEINTWRSDSTSFNQTTDRIPQECDDPSMNGEICSEIIIKNANHLDVGFYSCSYDGTEAVRIYLYVNETQKLKTREQLYFHWSGLEYSDIIFPCRPSHPGVNTSLKTPPGVLSADRGFSFSRRKGFIIQNANSSTDSGLYICNYEFKNLSAKSLIQVQILPSEGHMIPLKPQLDVIFKEDGDKRFLIQGETLKIKRGDILFVFCNVTLEHLNEIVKINWIKNGSILKNVYGENKDIDYFGNTHIYSVLELSNTYENASGTYTCSVTNRIGISNNRTFNVSLVKSESEDFCHLSLPELKESSVVQKTCFPIRVICGKDANISLILQDGVHSDYPNIFWITPKGQHYNSHDFEEYQHIKNYKWHGPKTHSNNVILEIQSTSFEENHGKYEFYCGSIQKGHGISVCVEILCDPEVVLIDDRNSYTYFALREDAEFNCVVKGNPRPEWIGWNICEKDNCTQKVDRNFIKDNDFTIHSNFRIENVSGIGMNVSCSGCYKKECSSSQVVNLDLVDYEPPAASAFGPCTLFDDTNERCLKILDDEERDSILYGYAMDNLTIVCAVKDRERGLNMTFDKEFKTNYSSQLHWIREFLRHEDNGTHLNCDNRGLTLRIMSSEIPSPGKSNNMMNQTLEVNRGSDIDMDCSMEGIPSPVITWYKDGQTLNESEVVGFLSRNRTNLLLHAYESSDGGMFRCLGVNVAGSYESFVIIKFNGVLKSLGSDRLTLTLMVIVLISFFIFVIFGIFFIICCRRYQIVKDELTKAEIELFLKGDLHSYELFGSKTEDLIDYLPYDETIEFPRDRLKISHQIGSGAFGRVMLAEAIGILNSEPLSLVAIKMCKPPVSKSQLTSLMSEIKIMLHLGKHLNVVNLLGACTTDLNKRELWVIVEYCRYGNLQQYLLRHRKSFIYPDSHESKERRHPLLIPTSSNDSSLVYATLIGRNETNQTENEETNEGSQQETTFTSIPTSTKSNDAYFEGIHNNTDMTSIGCSNYTSYSGGIMENGYRHYESREREPLRLKDLLSWSYQVARGMEHLMNKNVIHGDLAARNVLLSENNVVKICDFGLAKNTYAKSVYQKSGSGGLLPVKWMAVESLTHGIFSSRSDVWSYGILLWEMFSLGRCPYPGEEPDEGFRRRLESGYRMKCPTLAPPEIKRVMNDCWKGEAELRPNFSELAEKIGEKIHSVEKEHYLNLNSIYVNENQERELKYAELIRKAPSCVDLKEGSVSRNHSDRSSIDEDNPFESEKESAQTLLKEQLRISFNPEYFDDERNTECK
ncbi:vascular endothelial growth factor receptor 1 [Lepeophtheirus salmonis]